MLIFVVGGAYQGKYEFALTLGLPVINKLQAKIKELLLQGADVRSEVMKLIDQKDCVVVCDEIGCGIVPLKKEDRDYREIVGRIACELAKKADAVYKVEAGIALKIK